MNREELKMMFLQMDCSNIPVRKEIIVETEFGHVEILSDGPDGYSSFKTNQGVDALNYGKKLWKDKKYEDYKLIVK